MTPGVTQWSVAKQLEMSLVEPEKLENVQRCAKLVRSIQRKSVAATEGK